MHTSHTKLQNKKKENQLKHMPAVDAGRLNWKAAFMTGLFRGIVKYFSFSCVPNSD